MVAGTVNRSADLSITPPARPSRLRGPFPRLVITGHGKAWVFSSSATEGMRRVVPDLQPERRRVLLRQLVVPPAQ
jgi:hypothetical protein